MTQFVRFQVDNGARFGALQRVFAEIKAVKNLDFPIEPRETDAQVEDADYDVDRIRDLMPPDVQCNFRWPSADESNDHCSPPDKPIAISPPGALLSSEWSVVRILELIDSCEYSLDHCDMVGDSVAELHVLTWSYPYGGLSALMALVEGFGFHVLGVDECGKYESREELERNLG